MIVLAALAALPAVSFGQQRVGNDGHALDANNRIGSNGYNGGGGAPAPGVTQNDIVYGNVTAGREFRGAVQGGDPRQFRAPTGSIGVDRFTANSAGAPTPGAPNVPAYIPVPYYGDSRAVAPPLGYVREGFNPGYVPGTISNKPISGDARIMNQTMPGVENLPAPGQLVLPGPVDPSSQQSILSASPLYGIREWNPADAAGSNFIDNYLRPPQTDLDTAAIQRMRSELQQSAQPEGNQPNNANNPDNTKPNTDNNLGKPLPKPLDSPASPAMSGQAMEGQMKASALSGDINTGQSTRERLVSPTQQSAEYNELNKRLNDYYAQRKMTDEEAHRQFQAQWQAQRAGEPGKNVKPNPEQKTGEQPKTGLEAMGIPDYVKMSQEIANRKPKPSNQASPETVAPATNPALAPVKVNSLADGVKAKALHDALASAEKLMQDGQFAKAIGEYDVAARAVPNNPLILLGRANAELGGQFYVPADNHLRQAFVNSYQLLHGQYNIASWFGQERLQTIVEDLKKIANEDKKQARPVFLLAYIAYNTGNEQMAAGYLNEAEKRAGGKDAVIDLVRKHWNLPAEAEQNK
jgi:hypothetical protein